jgi:HK97 family phage portal protein
MSLFKNIKKIFSPKSQESFNIGEMSSEQLAYLLRLGGHDTFSGAFINENSAMRVAAAWRCADIISGAISTLPFDLIKRVEENVRAPAIEHPLRKVLTVKPNIWQTPMEFKRLLQMRLLLRGNAYALKVMLGGNVIGLIPISNDCINVEQNLDNSLTYSATMPNGRYVKLSQKEILHLRGMSLDGVKGLSVLKYMREALGLSLQAEQVGARIFKQGSMTGGVLKHPQKISDKARDNLKTSLEEKYSGADNAHKIMLLEEGMDFSPIAMTAEDAQFLETRDFQRYDIAMFFGVPPHMIGATEKTTSWGTGIEQQNIGFVTYTLNTWIKTWEETIVRDLLNEKDAETISPKFYTVGLLRGDVKTRWESYVKGMQWGVYSPDEVRALEDMNPRPDKKGGVFYEPPNTAGKQNEQGEESDEPSKITTN